MTSSTRFTHYVELGEHYLARLPDEIASGDFLQAAEKAWGAVAAFINANAEQREWTHGTHYWLRQTVSRLAEEENGRELPQQFMKATELHAHFYERFLTNEEAARNIQLTQDFAAALRRLLDSE